MIPIVGLFVSWIGLLGFGAWLAAKGGDAK
jgi:hypothetical protein